MSTTRPGLPHWRELTAAFRFSVQRDDTQLLRRARMLAVAHGVRMSYPGCDHLLDVIRAVVRGQIVDWIVDQIGAQPGDAMKCALVIDHMAAAHVRAERLLGSEPPVGAEHLHAAWSDVGELATQWSDLVAEVIDGQPPLSRR